MSYRKGGTRTCAECGRVRTIEGRELCCACYWRNRQAGTLDRFPRRFIPAVELVEDYEFLARTGYTRATAAERMGITKKRLEKAIERHNRRNGVTEGGAA